MDLPNRIPKATIDDLIEAHVEALLEKLTGPHSEEEVEAEIEAINDLENVAQGQLQIKCAWCGLDIGFKHSLEVTQQCVTHGICPDCFERIGFEQ